jgi:hypothetical protein
MKDAYASHKQDLVAAGAVYKRQPIQSSPATGATIATHAATQFAEDESKAKNFYWS